MKYTIAALIGAPFSLVAGAPALANDNLFGGPVSNYNIQDMTWEIPISSERNVTVVGTIEDAIHHLQQVAPEVAEARFPSPSGPESNTALLSSASASLNTPRPKNVTCSQDHKKAVHWHIQTGVMYLRRLHSGPEMSPNSCGRVSCSYDSAIWLCNDSPEHITLDSWGSVSDVGWALLLTSECHTGIWFAGTAYLDKWSVKAGYAKC